MELVYIHCSCAQAEANGDASHDSENGELTMFKTTQIFGEKAQYRLHTVACLHCVITCK